MADDLSKIAMPSVKPTRTLIGRIAFCLSLFLWLAFTLVNIVKVDISTATLYGLLVVIIAGSGAFIFSVVGLFLDKPKNWALAAFIITLAFELVVLFSCLNHAKK